MSDLGSVAFEIEVLGEAEARSQMEAHIRDQQRVVDAMDESARAAVRAAEIRERAVQREMKVYDQMVAEVNNLKRAYQTLASSFDPINKAQLQYQRGMELLQKALQEQIISDKEYERTLKGLETQMQQTIAAEKLRESQVIANEEKRTAAAIEKTTQAYERLVASLDPAAAAELKFAQASKTANDALERGVITKEQYAEISSRIASQRTVAMMEAEARATRQATAATSEAANEKRRLESELNAFTATVSQTERAQQMYARAQDLTTRAVREGIITQTRANDVMAETQFRIQSMGHYVNDMGQVMSRSDSAFSRWARGGIQQAGYQVTDFFIQMEMGTPIVTALGQQGSQLLGSFGQWGAVLGAGLAISAAVYMIWSKMADSAATLEDRIKSLEKAAGSVNDSLTKLEDLKFDGMVDGLKVGMTEIRNEFKMLIGLIEDVEKRALESKLGSLFETTGLSAYMKNFRMSSSILAQTTGEQKQFDFMGLSSEYEGRVVSNTLGGIGGDDREAILKSVEAARERLELQGMLTDEVQNYLSVLASELGIQDMLMEKEREKQAVRLEGAEVAKEAMDALRGLRVEDENEKYAEAMQIVQQYYVETIAGEQRAAEARNAAYAQSMFAIQGFHTERLGAERRAAEEGNTIYQGMLAVQAGHYANIRAEEEASLSALAEQYQIMAESQSEAYGIADGLSEAAMQALILAGVDISAPISAANAAAAGLAATLNIALNDAISLQNLRDIADANTGGGRGSDPRDFMPGGSKYVPEGASEFSYTAPKKGRGGGGSKAQEDALEKLREQIRLEDELLGKTEAYQRVIQALGEDRNKYSEAEINNVVREIEAIELKKRAMDEVNQITRVMQTSLEEGFMSMMSGTKSVEDAFKDMAYSIIQELYRVLVVQRLVGSWNSTTGTGNGIVGWIGKILGGFADGAAFSGGRVTAYANGGVVNNPTLFPMSGGLGLMGEAGPEAIMPLSRTSDGKLGVQVVGGGKGEQPVSVVNQITVPAGANADSVRAEVMKLLPTITEATTAGVIRARQRGGVMRDTFSR